MKIVFVLLSENIDVSRDKSHISVKISPRLQVVTELLQTEKNYVNILHTILNVGITVFTVLYTCK